MRVPNFFMQLMILAATLIVSACGGDNSSTPANVTLVSIEVTSTNLNIALGTTTQLSATGIYSDNTTRDITSAVNWSSSNTSIATVSNAGVATSVGVGNSTITAALKGVVGSTQLTVSSAALVSLEVTPINTSIALGTQQQFIAIGIFSDDTSQTLTTEVIWTASSGVNFSSSTAGLATATAVGTSTITATSGLISGSTVLNVAAATLSEIQVTTDMVSDSIAAGTEAQFTATGIYSDGSTPNITSAVTWYSDNTAVATISNTGLVTSYTAGEVVIRATQGSIFGEFTLTVSDATLSSITVTPINPSIAFGSKTQFTATGIFSDNTTQNLTQSVLWVSSSSVVATISNDISSHGLADLKAAGLATITAIQGSISGATTLTVTNATLVSIAVTPANPTIALGSTIPFTATGTYSDNTTQNLTTFVIWNSSDSAVAKISNAPGSNGLATPITAGGSTITARLGSISGTTLLTVGNPTLVSIAVTPGNSSIAFGSTAQFTATGTYSDSTTQNITNLVTWSSSNPVVATVNNTESAHGLAFLLTPGNITITATLAGVTGTTSLIVSSAVLQSIAVTPANLNTTVGSAPQFTAIGTYSDNSTQNLTRSVTWSSSAISVAVISNAAGSNGLAHAVGSGSSIMTATSGSIFGSTTLTVP